MRHSYLHRQPSARSRTAVHADARAASQRRPGADVLQPESDQVLDRAASFWSTRRIRCFLLLAPGQHGIGR